MLLFFFFFFFVQTTLFSIRHKFLFNTLKYLEPYQIFKMVAPNIDVFYVFVCFYTPAIFNGEEWAYSITAVHKYLRTFHLYVRKMASFC